MEQEDCASHGAQSGRRYQKDLRIEDSTGLSATMSSQLQYPNPGRSTIRIAVYLMTGVILTLDIEQNYTSEEILAILESEAELGLARSPSAVGQPVFALWLCSSQLEVQLRPSQRPVELAPKWKHLIKKYGWYQYGELDEEPILCFRRNVFLSRTEEEQIKEAKILELLYAEAKHNVLQGRYPCESQARYASLGALQARIELGAYNSQTHTLVFFRKHRGRFLPRHYTSPSFLFNLGFGLGLVGGKGAPEARLLEQYKRIPNHNGANTNARKLVRKYLEFCWGLPCYGAAFFYAQIERPVRGLASWITNGDKQVLVAINASGVYIIDDSHCNLLLGLKYSELCWEMAKPSDEENPDCLPCLFLQFPVRENGARVYKILQVFSRQAIMMDTLISAFVEKSRRDELTDKNTVGVQCDAASMNCSSIGSFTNKLSKLTLATFDEQGQCIGQMGSWSFQ
ncbi:putative FERM domain-containing protein FRMD8P1 isoform X2 [Prorops nasuta]|uniref:putative FERM domain-containing protein FRMD8P1 isoform X2 n=1 Tax=Prorops nasuta TaxID=863751 RepID=UPI0034CFC702